MKRGQVTVFVILAIVILAIVGLIAYYNETIRAKLGDTTLRGVSLPAEVREVQSYIQGCVEETSNDALVMIGSQGGYYNLPRGNFEGSLAYYYYDGRTMVPSLQEIGQEVSDYINNNLANCVDFNEFPRLGFEDERPIAKVKILEENVDVAVTYNVVIESETESYNLKEPYYVNVPVRLGKIYEVSKEIVNMEKKGIENFCISCLLDIGIENKLRISLDNFDNDLIFSITDDYSKMDEGFYIFMFANKLR
jgi:hypothetical protein